MEFTTRGSVNRSHTRPRKRPFFSFVASDISFDYVNWEQGREESAHQLWNTVEAELIKRYTLRLPVGTSRTAAINNSSQLDSPAS